MSWFNKVHELGSKIGHSAYTLGKKVLAGGIGLGHKVKAIASHPVAQGIYDLLPSAIQAPIKMGLKAGEQLLNAGEALQAGINAGEDMYNKVMTSKGRSVEIANRGSSRAPNALAISKPQSDDTRIPQQMTTGGRQGTIIGYNRPGVKMGPYEAPY